MHNKKKLIIKGQDGLLAPTVYNGVIGDITTQNGLLNHTANLSNIIDSSGFQDLLKKSDSRFLNSLGKSSNLFTTNLGNSGLNVGNITNSALGVVDSLTPKAEDKASKVTSGVFNGLSSLASVIPGGGLASVALKGLGTLFGAGVKKVKGNAADEMVDTSSSYTGADALSDKRFGLLGLGKAKDYKQDVNKRQWERDTAHNILQTGKDDLLASNNVQQLQLKDNLSKNASNWMYNIRVGEFGMKINEAKRLSKLAKKKAVTSGEPRKEGTTELREGGIVSKTEPVRSIEPTTDTFYSKVNKLYQKEKDSQKSVEMFQNGGQVNVIPEGALHARKNNLTDINPELEGITPKGIPVITQEEGGIVQHAEVERSEIIFTKEVTDKLEELRKIGTDEAAIEAGKLLASQIMENTVDNTGELLHES